MEVKLGQNHICQLRPGTPEAKVGRIIAEKLQRLGWTDRNLAWRRASDPEKWVLAGATVMEMSRSPLTNNSAVASATLIFGYALVVANISRPLASGDTRRSLQRALPPLWNFRARR